jgi:hypothetical protein
MILICMSLDFVEAPLDLIGFVYTPGVDNLL